MHKGISKRMGLQNGELWEISEAGTMEYVYFWYPFGSFERTPRGIRLYWSKNSGFVQEEDGKRLGGFEACFGVEVGRAAGRCNAITVTGQGLVVDWEVGGAGLDGVVGEEREFLGCVGGEGSLILHLIWKRHLSLGSIALQL